MWINKDKIIYAQIRTLYRKPLTRKETAETRGYYVEAAIGFREKGVIEVNIFSAQTREECEVFLNKINRSMEEAVLSSEELNLPDYEKEAREYIDALEDHHCVAFLEALHKISAQMIVKHWEKFAPNQLEEEYYKPYLKFKQ